MGDPLYFATSAYSNEGYIAAIRRRPPGRRR